MNDKPGGTLEPFNIGMASGNDPRPRPSMPSTSPSNFGARPAPSAPPVQPLSGGPANMGQKPGTLSGKPDGMSIEEFTSIPGPAEMGKSASHDAAEAEKKMQANDAAKAMAGNPTVANMNGMIANAASGATIDSAANRPGGASPMSRPMTKAAMKMPVQKKKPNKPLIIGLSCAGVVLLLAVVIGVVVAMTNKPDPVAKAMDKLVSNGLPQYIALKGDLNVQKNDDKALVSHYKLSVDSQLNPSSLTNDTDVTVTFGGKQMDDATFQMSEIYAGNDDLYFKFDGVDTAIEDYFATKEYIESSKHTEDRVYGEEEELECVDEDDNPVACEDEEVEATAESDGNSSSSTGSSTDGSADEEEATDDETVAAGETIDVDSTEELGYSDVVLQIFMMMTRVADGQWIQMTLPDADATDETGQATPAESETIIDETEVAAEDSEGLDVDEIDYTAEGQQKIMTDLASNPDDIVDLIGGSRTSCDINLFGTLRNNLSVVTEYYRSNPFLGGTRNNVTLAPVAYPVYRIVFDEDKFESFVTALQNKGLLATYLKCSGKNMTDVMTLPSQLPAIYTEVDSEYNFTRFYFASNSGDQSMNLDLGITYPKEIFVQQPTEYNGFMDILQRTIAGEGLEEEVTVDETTTE